MDALKILGLDGKFKAIDGPALDALAANVRGSLITADDEGYDEARSIWNAMIDKKPAMIVQCGGAADVMAAVKFAREHKLLIAVRSGGHNIAGNAICDDGIMIDLSAMKQVRVDVEKKIAYVGPGADLGDLDHETQAHGLAVPVGINSTTGIAGLTLGGGFGWLSRKFGMTCDNLVSADVVTVDGEYIHVSENEHRDLFWAIRGGGGNFCIVTQFQFKLHSVGPNLLSGMYAFPGSEGVEVIKNYRKYIGSLDDDATVWVVARKAPPLPFLPAEYHGTDIVVVAVFYAGDPEKGKKVFEPINKFGNFIGGFLDVLPFTAWQAIFDPLLTPGARNYWKSHNFTELNDEAVELAVEYAGKAPSPHCEIFFAQVGGQINRIDSGTNAYAHREANFVMNVHGRWEDSGDDEKCIKWARDFFAATKPYAASGVYINFMTAEEKDRVESAYGDNYARLGEIKQKYDPDNILRINQNIVPDKQAVETAV